MGLRSGRIDIFDEIRAAAQARSQRLKGEKMQVAVMSDMHRHLRKIVKKVLDNADETAPDSDTLELDLKYYTELINFLTIAKGSPKYNTIGSVDAKDVKFNDINNTINGDSDLKDRVKKPVKTTELNKIKSSDKNYWIEVLKRSFEEDATPSNELNKANKRKTRLEKKDNTQNYLSGIEELKEAKKKLHAAQMEIKWIKRDTEEVADKSSDLAESEGGSRDSGEDDIRKHYKKLGNAKKIYAESTTCAIDTLIDIYRAVDSENQKKIIGPQSKNVIFKIQQINGTDMVKEAKKEIAELTKSNEKQMKKEQKKLGPQSDSEDVDSAGKAPGGTYKMLGSY